MITKLRISEPENIIYFEVDKEGYYHVTVRNGDGTLIFEKIGWELLPDIQFTMTATSKINNPDIQINPFVPEIITKIDYVENKIYISTDQEIEMKIKVYDTFNNRIIWRLSHRFDNKRVWYSPANKLAVMGNLMIIAKDKWGNVLTTRTIKNELYHFCHIPKTAGTSIKKVLGYRTPLTKKK